MPFYNTSLSPGQRTERARIAANARWSRLSAAQRRAATVPGLRAIEEHFEKQVDPEGILSSTERTRLAKNAKAEQLARARFTASRKRQKERAAM